VIFLLDADHPFVDPFAASEAAASFFDVWERAGGSQG